MRHLRPLALAMLLLATTQEASAREETPENAIRLPETMALTKDGATVVFSWRGDLWRVPRSGGPARRLTFHPAQDTRPYISPDGSLIGFVSDRSGTEQVHVMPIEGGRPRQVTLHSEGATLHGWFPDGKHVLTRSQRDHHWRSSSRFFRKPLELEKQGELLFDAACRSGAVSPDGGWIAFTREGMSWTRKRYRGPKASQVWLYSLADGSFTRLSTGDHGELWPLWGGGSQLYYVSEESGTWNLWRRDTSTSETTQITFFEDDGVSSPAISGDYGTIVFRRLFDMYSVGTRGGAKPQRVLAYDAGDPSVELTERRTLTRATDAAFTDDAREIAVIAGGDLWVMDTELKEPKRVTSTAEAEREPLFARDHEALYFVSDAGGSPDIWRAKRADEKKYWWQNDEFLVERLSEDEAVESNLRLTPDGKRLAYIRGTELRTSDLEGRDVRTHAASFSGVDYDFSPDGRWIAYAKPDDDFNWDVWIAPTDGSSEPFNVSRHPDNDGDPAWSPDGKILAFTGRRWSEESDICYVYLRKEDAERSRRDRTLEMALKKMKGRKSKAGKQPAKPTPPPGGNAEPKAAPATRDALAGTWKGTLRGPQPLPADGVGLVFELTKIEGGDYSCGVEVVNFFTGQTDSLAYDPQSGAFEFTIKTPLGALSGEGKVQGERMEGTWEIPDTMQGTFEVSREKPELKGTEPKNTGAKSTESTPAKPKKPAAAGNKQAPQATQIDFEGLEDRIQRIAIIDTRERGLFWSHDSKRLAFQASVDGKSGIYTVGFPDDLKPKLLTTSRGSKPRWLKEGNQFVWLSSGAPTAVSASGRTTAYRFSTRQEVYVPDMNGAAFDVAWRTMRDRYYDPKMGGADWEAVRAKYAPMAARCATGTELSLVMNLMLGELNGSHLGFRSSQRGWTRSGWREVTGHLGCRFDATWNGEGLRVKDVVPGTPADQARSRIHPGEVILALDGRPVGGATNLDLLMTGDPQRDIEVRVRDAEGNDRTVTLQPTSYGAVRRLLYDHWVEQTRAQVEEASGGTLGYLHIRSMNLSSFQRFEAELYKVGFGKDGLIIDVRDNGGGFTTDHLLTCLTQPRHAITVPRHGGPGYPHDRMVYAPWHKPVVVLCNQNSFSNAEIFAHAIKTLKRGAVVGVQTAGGVISTGATFIDGIGSLRLPFRGWFLLNDGEDMERNGCMPHHVVWPEPSDLKAGIDRQLSKAVEVGLDEVKAWKAKPRVKPRYASER
jgi:Tol biopolymer transport system component/C-terminal processing protease CtpA/Prc